MIFDKLLALFSMEEPSDYEDYYEGLSWKTFRVDESIWNENPRKRPKIGYYRKLQRCYEQLLEEASESFLYDVNELKRVFNQMHLQNCELEKKLAIAEGQVEILQYRLDSAMASQTKAQKKEELFSSQGIDLERKEVKTEKSGTRFTSNNGASLQDNQMLAAAYFVNGWTLPEIAEELQVAEQTVKVYVSTMQKHYKTQYIQGRKQIVFDQEYGSVVWDLALYERISMKFPAVEAV